MPELEQAVQFVRECCHLYLEEREYWKIFGMLPEDVAWIGTGEQELVHDREEARRMLAAELAAWDGRFTILEEEYHLVPLGTGAAAVYGLLHVKEASDEPVVMDVTIRISVVVREKSGGGWEIAHAHISVPSADQQADEFFPNRITALKAEVYEEIIREKNLELEKAKEEIAENAESYRLAMEVTNDLVFEMEVDSGYISVDPDKFEALFERRPLAPRMLLSNDFAKYLHPDDASRLESRWPMLLNNKLHRLPKGVITTELRILREKSGFFWVSVTLVPIVGKDGKAYKLIGSIKNIDGDKRQELEMLRKSRVDGLTGLYNRVYTEQRVDELLAARKTKSAMLLMDIDNFKSINDTLGHLLGDTVLRELAAKIEGTVDDDSAVVGRIGGDEFLIFIPEVADKRQLKELAARLCALFDGMRFGKDGTYTVTGSVGIAIAPENGYGYEELFIAADRALYHVKNHGKNRWSFFKREYLAEKYTACKNTAIDQSSSGDTGDLIRYIFQTLYETRDIPAAIELILQIIGKYFNVSRVYLFENSPDGTSCSNTIEWCDDGILPMKDMLQNIKYSEIGDYLSLFDSNGVFYCPNVSELSKELLDLLSVQGVHSMLQCLVREDGEIKGYVGFDECRKSRLWTKEEIEMLSFISKIIGTFLLKLYSKEQLHEIRERLDRILDNLNLYAYTVDPETYRLVYLNQSTMRAVPEAKVGDLCYSVLRGRSAPCKDCPMHRLMSTGIARAQEIYNDKLGLWVNTYASKIPWDDGRALCMLSCSDVTKYKTKERKE